MTQDEITNMAREAGSLVFQSNFYENSFDFNLEQLERFAALVAAHEREACANVVESGVLGHVECAAAIRARGEK